MKKILLTGGSGFVGKNILPILRECFDVDTPNRHELNLLDYNDVFLWLNNNKYDAVIHSANPNPVKNSKYDKQENMMEDSLRMFMNFYNCRNMYGKMIFLGSGAEYDKSSNICSVKEEQINIRIPYEQYGLAKLYMNELARKSENIYNFRLFGCYGPYDHESKFITHVINNCIDKEDITIRQDCWFDYIQVTDVGKLLCYAIENELKYYDYNICSGERILLSTIAEKVRKQMNSDSKIVILNSGFNKEYTGDNTRIVEETGYKFMNLDEGIKIQIEHERSKR